MAFGFGSFGGSLLGALGMPQTGGVTGQPSVDPNQLQMAPDQGTAQSGGIVSSTSPDIYADIGGAPRDPSGRTLQDIFAGRAGTPPPGWQYQPGDPNQATDQGGWGGGMNPGGQTMPPAAGGVFGGGASMGQSDPWSGAPPNNPGAAPEQGYWGSNTGMHTMQYTPQQAEFDRFFRDYWSPDRAAVLASKRYGGGGLSGQKQGPFQTFSDMIRSRMMQR